MNAKIIFIAAMFGLTIGTFAGVAGASEKAIDLPVTVITVPAPKPAPRLVCGVWNPSLAGGQVRICEWR